LAHTGYTLLRARETQNAGQRAKRPNGFLSWTSFYRQLLRIVPNWREALFPSPTGLDAVLNEHIIAEYQFQPNSGWKRALACFEQSGHRIAPISE
jgi:hypothetical protein